MKCPECGATTKVTREDHPYTEAGLPNVILRGVEIRLCPKCGERELVIPRIEQLHRELAFAFAGRKAHLTPAEIRFMRKYLGWSGKDFARAMGVTPEQVSRWENGAPMGATAERLLRLMVLRERPVEEYPNDRLAEIGDDFEEDTPTLTFRASTNGWRAEAA